MGPQLYSNLGDPAKSLDVTECSHRIVLLSASLPHSDPLIMLRCASKREDLGLRAWTAQNGGTGKEAKGTRNQTCNHNTADLT